MRIVRTLSRRVSLVFVVLAPRWFAESFLLLCVLRFVAVFPDLYAKRLIIFDAFWRNWPRFKVMQKLDCCSIDMVLA